jgi:hypothetical protein
VRLHPLASWYVRAFAFALAYLTLVDWRLDGAHGRSAGVSVWLVDVEDRRWRWGQTGWRTSWGIWSWPSLTCCMGEQ